ncbi:MAG: diacylglycerol kinase family lipid kinase [Cyclobacteriaceae bacterium]|nr:diacylglycerol kinase family lipid kinase [Cyclobacteriaceae bacterium]
MKQIAIVLNGVSRRKRHFYHSILPALQQEGRGIEVHETQHAGHATQLAEILTDNGAEVILAAGGDGTLNQVLNGVMMAKGPKPILGIIPLGTGNDFARLFGIKAEANLLKQLISAEPRLIDIGRISCQKEGIVVTHYFLNVCSLGMGPRVVQLLKSSKRSLGPAMTYFKAILRAFFTHTPEPMELKSSEFEWSGRIRACCFANGTSFGNGLYIAPAARPDDGLFSLFIAGEVSLLEFLRFQAQLKRGNTIYHDRVHYETGVRFEVRSPKPMWIEAEGELAGTLPATIELDKERILFLGGAYER